MAWQRLSLLKDKEFGARNNLISCISCHFSLSLQMHSLRDRVLNTGARYFVTDLVAANLHVIKVSINENLTV